MSIFLIAVGAILRFALETWVEGIDLGVAGVVMMVVGVIGLISLAFSSSLSPSRRRASVADSDVVVHETETVSTREPEIV